MMIVMSAMTSELIPLLKKRGGVSRLKECKCYLRRMRINVPMLVRTEKTGAMMERNSLSDSCVSPGTMIVSPGDNRGGVSPFSLKSVRLTGMTSVLTDESACIVRLTISTLSISASGAGPPASEINWTMSVELGTSYCPGLPTYPQRLTVMRSPPCAVREYKVGADGVIVVPCGTSVLCASAGVAARKVNIAMKKEKRFR